MLKRLLAGLFKGVLVGLVVAVVLSRGLGVTEFGALVAYVTAAVVGVLTGFIAGKPIWAPGARIEAGLKAVAGALLGAGLMFALRRWALFEVDLGSWGAGAGPVGELAATSLPVIATVLAVLFDLDNTGDEEARSQREAKASGVRVGGDAGSSVGDELEDLEGDDASAGDRQARR